MKFLSSILSTAVLIRSTLSYESKHQNETLQLVLSQGLFDNFTADFLAPTIGKLTQLQFGDMTNEHISIEGLTTDFNVTNLKIAEAYLDGQTPGVQIGDEQMRFQLADFTLELSFDYEFITDPPIFADIGTAQVNIRGMTFAADIKTFLEESFSMQLVDLKLDFQNPGGLLNLDGLNDFGIVINDTLNHFTSIFRNRLSSMVNEQIFTEKFSSIANKVLALVPNDIELLNSDFYIEGLLYSNPTYVQNQYMQVHLETSIQSETYPYPQNCTTQLPQVVTTPLDYQI